MTTAAEPLVLSEECLENERRCDWRGVNPDTWEVIERCEAAAEWIAPMKCCGGQSLFCDPHKEYLNNTPVTARRCHHCRTRGFTGTLIAAFYRV